MAGVPAAPTLEVAGEDSIRVRYTLPKGSTHAAVRLREVGDASWQVIDALSTADMSNPITFKGGLMDVQLPFAGIYCAFSNPDVEDVSCCKFHVFAAPQCARDAPSTVRIHLCPELPDQIAEMELAENSEWGLSTRVGGFEQSITVIQGTYFHLKLILS